MDNVHSVLHLGLGGLQQLFRGRLGLNRVVFAFDANKLLRGDTAPNNPLNIFLFQMIRTLMMRMNVRLALGRV